MSTSVFLLLGTLCSPLWPVKYKLEYVEAIEELEDGGICSDVM